MLFSGINIITHSMNSLINAKFPMQKSVIAIATVAVSCVAVYFPYPFLANFIFSMIWDFVLQVWAATLAIPDITRLRIALTSLLLVGLLLFLSLQKLSSICKANRLSFLKWISLICSWYSLIMTIVVIFVMWFDVVFARSENSLSAIFGHMLHRWASMQLD